MNCLVDEVGHVLVNVGDKQGSDDRNPSEGETAQVHNLESRSVGVLCSGGECGKNFGVDSRNRLEGSVRPISHSCEECRNTAGRKSS